MNIICKCDECRLEAEVGLCQGCYDAQLDGARQEGYKEGYEKGENDSGV